jgi:hypothetical protein
MYWAELWGCVPARGMNGYRNHLNQDMIWAQGTFLRMVMSLQVSWKAGISWLVSPLYASRDYAQWLVITAMVLNVFAVKLITGKLWLVETISFVSLYMILFMDPLMLNALCFLNKCSALWRWVGLPGFQPVSYGFFDSWVHSVPLILWGVQILALKEPVLRPNPCLCSCRRKKITLCKLIVTYVTFYCMKL